MSFTSPILVECSRFCRDGLLFGLIGTLFTTSVHAAPLPATLDSEEITEEAIILTDEEYDYAAQCGANAGDQVVGDWQQRSSLEDSPQAEILEILCHFVTVDLDIGCNVGCRIAFPDNTNWQQNERFRQNQRRRLCILVCRSRGHSIVPWCPFPQEVAE